MDFDAEAIPAELRERDQWICWAAEVREDKDGEAYKTKVPRDPADPASRCDPTDPDDWTDFETAVAAATDAGVGIGFCFDLEGLVAGVDLDDCRDPETGEIEPWAADVVERLDSWSQVSTSGTGLHVFVFGFLPGDSNRRGDVEMYDAERFFAMTGDHLEGTPETVEQRNSALADVYGEFIAEDTDEDQQTLADVDAETPDISDEELLEKARNAKNGDKFERLWNGDTSEYARGDNDGFSEGVLALLNMLAFWTAGDPARMEALFKRSNLYPHPTKPGKFDRLLGDEIETAVNAVSEYYQPPRHEPLEGVEPVDDPDPDPTEEQLEAMLEPEDGPTTLDDVFEDGEARANGGTQAGAGTSTGGPSGIASWPEIRAQYQRAHDGDVNATKIRQQARYVATRRLEEVEADFATNEVSENLHVYGPDVGIYLDRGKAFVQERLVEELREQFTSNELNEVVAQIKGRTFHHPDEFGGPPGYVCVANGILEVSRDGVDRIIDHTPDYLFQARVETPYDPDAECPRWLQFLEEVVPREEGRQTLQEYVGYTLMNWGMPHAKALFIAGPTASGKSTFLDVVRALLGDDTVSSIAPQQFGRNRFVAIKLWGAWANIRNDVDADVVKNIGLFKEMTSGDPIEVEEKNQPSFTITPTAKHLYSANQLPDIDTDDEAFYRRVVLVTFPHTVPPEKRVPKEPFQEELLEEKPGILNWAIEGLNRLMSQGRLTGDDTPGATKEQWELWGDAIGRFKSECLVKEVDAFVEKSVAHSAFIAFCDARGLPSASQQKLTRELKKDKDISDARRTPDGKSRQVRVYTGVRLDDEWEPDSDDGDGGDGPGRLSDF